MVTVETINSQNKSEKQKTQNGFKKPAGEDDPSTSRASLELKAQLPWVVPFDPRFPHTNQTRNCYQNYVDYHRCVKAKNLRGEPVQSCEYFKKAYKSLCPKMWFQTWDTQIAENRFPGRI
ncbi:cytochrome c oxidase subunit 6B2-like isoform X2 [Varroa jacobsoni]|uniref:Cytochrome c oxidase subunit 6B1 n=1 Tax=Varroa destructor TaxID=109461 RepID=A0A7M7JCU0_VARDE|nr:cytochrome c oxidase subunit 6B2-like isoform X2 [Varroa destructor]XP_022692294.1 cytochrome c oxidase subunit 6B2-like isoform X2 [Varroa jacobsoni]